MGGAGVCTGNCGVTELDAEAPGTYARDTLGLLLSNMEDSRESFGAAAPLLVLGQGCDLGSCVAVAIWEVA